MPKTKRSKQEYVTIRVYLSGAEKKIVKRQARVLGLSVNAYIRSVVKLPGKRGKAKNLVQGIWRQSP